MQHKISAHSIYIIEMTLYDKIKCYESIQETLKNLPEAIVYDLDELKALCVKNVMKYTKGSCNPYQVMNYINEILQD